ncbi:ABC transporter [Whalleya microplaca]|nr:ABC transporter [Whalleya microplaca]
MAQILKPENVTTDLSIILSVLFFSLALVRLWRLRNVPTVVIGGFQGCAKALLSSLLILSTLAGFFTTLKSIQDVNGLTVASRALTFVAALVLSPLSWLEHRRSTRPSDLIALYLIACVIRDVYILSWSIQGQREWIIQDPMPAQIVLEAALLATESLQKDIVKSQSNQCTSPEETSGILGRTFFWWINPILSEGYHKILLCCHLPSIDTELSSAPVSLNALRTWNQRTKPETQMTLPKVLVKSLEAPFLLAIPPRIFLVLFRYSQPILVRQAIIYVTKSKPKSENWTGQGLVIASLVVYIGLAISSTMYQHRLNRLRVMSRAVLVALIYSKTMNSYTETASEGKVITLVSTDVDNLDTVCEMFHETWGQIVEFSVGIILLSWEVGWLSLVPLLMIFPCSRMSQYVAKNLRSRQGRWNEATQSRISMTSAVISTMKNIKMLGLQDAMFAHIQDLRQHELGVASRVRWMMVAYNASANALGMFAPVLTLVLYAILAKLRGSQLDTETAFTTIAILSMVTHPANMVMTIIPRAVASFASFERIQHYLLQESRQDHKTDIKSSKIISELGDIASGPMDGSHPAISIRGLSVGTSSCLSLEDINLTIKKASIVMCSGATAAGKTVLAHSILGEIPSVGVVRVFSNRIGYCSQAPWLPNGSIQEVIKGFSIERNEDRYQTILDVCHLRKDIESLPHRDETLVGSRGMNLSGGQRQRVALARALFPETDILLLDDTFSALDGKTENQIVEDLLGPKGLLRERGTTVLMMSNSTQFFHLADEVIVLEGGRIMEQGRWNKMKHHTSHISKITTGEVDAHDSMTMAVNHIDRPQQLSAIIEADLDLKRAAGDTALYGYYIKATARSNFLTLLTFNALYSFFITFPQYWLKLWTELGSQNDWFFIGGYIALNLIAWIFTNITMWSTLIRIAPHSGAVLHAKVLETVIRAPLSYFSKTDSGSILNRFSQDLELVDKKLPSAVSTVTVQIFKLVVQVVLLFIAQKMLTFTLPICLVVLYVVQKVYLRTSRQLRLLELETRSGLLTSLLETIDGLPTIRAFGGQSEAESRQFRNLDDSHKPFYLLLSLQCWLKIVLDLLVAGIAVGIIALAVALKDTTSGGQVGVALNIVLVANTTLLRLVESWTNLEISLGAISRIKTLEAEVPSEDQTRDTVVPPETWPISGEVVIENLSASYNENIVALNNVSLRIAPGQKAVICGRTGSGKSSLILTFLRLLDFKSGSVKIDGLDISRIPRSVVRERCFVTVSQEPLLLSQGTLRFNVDPTESLANGTIIDVLEKVHLWKHFNSTYREDEAPASDHESQRVQTTSHPILDGTLGSLPSLSVGQGQLIALARALLQVYTISASGAKPVILLDEATSSLDPETEAIMLDIIHNELTCQRYTVIVVAHRLSIAASRMRKGVDVVIWMKDGKIEKVGDANDIIMSVGKLAHGEAEDM